MVHGGQEKGPWQEIAFDATACYSVGRAAKKVFWEETATDSGGSGGARPLRPALRPFRF